MLVGIENIVVMLRIVTRQLAKAILGGRKRGFRENNATKTQKVHMIIQIYGFYHYENNMKAILKIIFNYLPKNIRSRTKINVWL